MNQLSAQLNRLDVVRRLASIDLPLAPIIIIDQERLALLQQRDSQEVQALLAIYHDEWREGFISLLSNDPRYAYLDAHNIQGEANLFHTLDTLPSQHAPYLMQLQPQPTVSGTALTLHPETGHHHQWFIQATWGVFDEDHPSAHDSWLVDARTHAALTTSVVTKRTHLVRTPDSLQDKSTPKKYQDQASLTSKQLHEVIELTQTVHRQFLHPVSISWFFAENQLFISRVNEVERINLPTNQEKPLLQGANINAGNVSGRVVTDLHLFRQHHQGDILVTKSLTRSDLPLLSHVTGIITDDYITDGQVISFIKKHHLPALAHTQRATQILKHLQSIMLDAENGFVFAGTDHAMSEKTLRTNSFSLSKKQPTRPTKLFSWSSNPYKQQNNPRNLDGIIVKSDFLFAFENTHPLHLAQGKPRLIQRTITKALEKFSSQTKVVAYQTHNLHSEDLRRLDHGNTYEEESQNPWLGLRGGLYIIHHQEIFIQEIRGVAEFCQKHQIDLPIIVPFTRSVNELLFVGSLLEDINQEYKTNLSLFVDISLPIQIAQISEWLRPITKGLVFNTHALHHLIQGIDPESSELDQHYSFPDRVLSDYLQTVNQARSGQPLWLSINRPHHHLLENALHCGIEAIIAKPAQIDVLNNIVEEIQKDILYGNH